MTSGRAPIAVGYLHLGKAESGVRRYGRIVASAVGARDDVRVLESDAGGREAGLSDLRRAARHLREADVVHLQWKLADWGGVRWALPRLEVALQACRRPMVVTLHDVYERATFAERWLEPGALGLRRLQVRARALVVHGEEERRRLGTLVPAHRVAVVPHFVERRPPLPDREAAKAELGLTGRHVVTLQGFMTRRKGHRAVLDALAHLPADVVAIFAGAPIGGREARAEELEAYATEVGVRDRVRFTGYVPDATLTTILAATDVALCPYRTMSASGSVSTWLATGRPLVTSDLAQFREYDALVPGSMRMVDPADPRALADRIARTLDEGLLTDPRVERLAELLAAPLVAGRYVEVYRRAAGG